MPSNLTPRINYLEDGTTGPLSFRNKIINGGFDIWQRGTSQTSDGYGSDDRWTNEHAGSTKTHSQQAFTVGQTDVPGNPRFFSRTVATSVAGSGNYVRKIQKVEGVRAFAGQTATLSFWAKADASKNIAIEFAQGFGTGGSPSAAVLGIGVTTCALTTSWKKFTITVSIPSISGKVIGTNNDDLLQLLFWFDAGSSFNARTNSLGQQSGTFDIANVQLEAGTQATVFEHRPIGMELQLCQRYYYKRLGSSDNYTCYGSGIVYTTTAVIFAMQHPVIMRSNNPMITVSGSFQALSTSQLGLSNPNISQKTFTDYQLSFDTTGGTAGQACLLRGFNSSTTFISAESEL